MKLWTETETLPAHWAPALINGDFSGLDNVEERDVNAWLASMPHYGGCLSCSEYAELAYFEGLLTNCLEFTFPVTFYTTREYIEYGDNGVPVTRQIHTLIYPYIGKENPLPWQKLGLSYTASGYGKKIPTSKMILLCGVWRRVYCTIYSNSGTCWVNFDGKQVIV